MKKGSVIIAKHKKSGAIMNYMIVKESIDFGDSRFRLLNLDSLNIMHGFRTYKVEEILEYLTKTVKCEILKISE